jgi:putative chitinase
MLTLEQFKLICPACKEPEEWCELLSSELYHHGFETNEQIAMFIAQTAHESMEYNVLTENLNYSAERLLVVFPKYFRGVDTKPFHRNPQDIANRVYANRMGNGSPDSGDGYKYRGRGVLQVTGKNNYRACSEYLYGDPNVLLEDPDQLLYKPNALGSALWYWFANRLLMVSDITKATKIINGGNIGMEDRVKKYNKILNILSSSTTD